jgi:predicted MPP superfamily phosphohydrolase
MERPQPLEEKAEIGCRFAPGPVVNPRQMWANNRLWMETQNLVTRRYGGKRKQHWQALLFMMKTFAWGLRCLGQYERGYRNASRLILRERDLSFAHLPPAFDGFSILHISDPHFDGMPGLEEQILALARGREFDLCVLTGDYRTELHGPFRTVMASLERLVGGIRSRQGFLGVLGNHDDCHMVEPMERMGIRMLINESVVLRRHGERLRFVGTDDVHYYYTDQSLHALEVARDDFTVALIHSPELYDAAARAGVALYLCGHTHGGQVCLPGGRAILKHVRTGRHLPSGHWTHEGMQGITNVGAGTSGIPVRFNTEGEVLVLRLRRGDPGGTGSGQSDPVEPAPWAMRAAT